MRLVGGEKSGKSGPCAISRPADNQVVLADGSVCTLDGLARDELLALQWQQEREFARRILAAAKGSSARSQATCQAYDSVTRILARVQGSLDRPLVLGMHPRYGRLVVDLLRRQQRDGRAARFFEIGYGTGKLLKNVAGAGFPIAGIEIASAMREQAVEQIGAKYASCLYVGEFLKCTSALADGPWSLTYWNDVFEHIPPDEIGELAATHLPDAAARRAVGDHHAQLALPTLGCNGQDLSAADGSGRFTPERVYARRGQRHASPDRLHTRGDSAGRHATADRLVRKWIDRPETPVGAEP